MAFMQMMHADLTAIDDWVSIYGPKNAIRSYL